MTCILPEVSWLFFKARTTRESKLIANEQIIVGPGEPKQRVDVFLAAKLARLSRSRIQGLIESDHISINGKTCRASQQVRSGDTITISEPMPAPIGLAPEDIPLKILFEDDHLLVVDKPAGMVVHPGAGVRTGTLVNALLHHIDNLSGIGGELRPGVVHRLDRETSGCLLVAKNDQAHSRLSSQFAGRKVRKFYLAMCSGKFASESGEIIKPIGRHPVHRQKMAITDSGRVAHTTYKVIYEQPSWSLVLCQIFTGRTHQIRVHLHSIGHAILGDKIYGKTGDGYSRHMLHAWRIGFFHPITENWLEFEAEFPDDFRRSGADANAVIRARTEAGR
jgi:23S rRNA pseudouridine1911/1915/1917 synthase